MARKTKEQIISEKQAKTLEEKMIELQQKQIKKAITVSKGQKV